MFFPPSGDAKDIKDSKQLIHVGNTNNIFAFHDNLATLFESMMETIEDL